MADKSSEGQWTPEDIEKAAVNTGAVELTGDRSNRQKDKLPSESVGLKPTLMYAAKERLYVPIEFQRLVNPGHVAKILANFDYGYVHPIHTGPENERGFPIIDGQHEWLASLRHPLVDEVPLAVAYWADTTAKMADIFVKLNFNRINITSTGIFYARVAQGDEEAVWMDTLLTNAGLRMSRIISGNLPPLTTCAIGTLRKLRHMEKWLAPALELMAQAWPNQTNSFQAGMIEGVTKFLALHHKNSVDLDRLRQVLTRISSGDEVTAATQRAKAFEVTVAQTLVDLLTKHYNDRLAQVKHLPRLEWKKGFSPA